MCADWFGIVCGCRDQVAYVKPGTDASIGVLGDEGQVNQELTSFVRKVITEYGQPRTSSVLLFYRSELTCRCAPFSRRSLRSVALAKLRLVHAERLADLVCPTVQSTPSAATLARTTVSLPELQRYA